MMAKFNSFVLASTALALVAQIAVLTPGLAQAVPALKDTVHERMELAGPIKTGGGNGAKDPNGVVTPLDALFAQKVRRNVDIKAQFPAGTKYFQQQVAKIGKVMPTFAKDIEKVFSELKWKLSELELTGTSGPCLNNMGIFRLPRGNSQVVLACQDRQGRVTVNMNQVRALGEPRLMGVVFLHEAFVNRMLAQLDDSKYRDVENELITEIIPTILSSSALDAETLYQQALLTGFDYGYEFSPYALEAKSENRERYEQFTAKAEAFRSLEQTRDRALTEVEQMIQVLVECKPDDTRINSSEARKQFFEAAYSKREAYTQAQIAVTAEARSLMSDPFIPGRERTHYSIMYDNNDRAFRDKIRYLTDRILNTGCGRNN